MGGRRSERGGRPARRYYRLTTDGVDQARDGLARAYPTGPVCDPAAARDELTMRTSRSRVVQVGGQLRPVATAYVAGGQRAGGRPDDALSCSDSWANPSARSGKPAQF